MTNEERDIINQFIARVAGAQGQSGFAGGAVSAQPQPALPPVDREADQLIAQRFEQYPEARYRITQLAFVQEHALVEAQNRIKRLEWELQQAQQAIQQAQQQTNQRSGAAGGGFFSSLFGGNRQQAGGPQQGGPGPWGQSGPQQGYYQPSGPPPQPQYPPNYQQGMFQRQGSGFLGSALTTAAGVAGGMVAGNALMSLFSPHHDVFGGGAMGGSPWASPGQGSTDTGSWGGGAAPAGNQDYVDQGGWDQNSNWSDNSASSDQSWTDNSGGGGSDWDSGGGGSDDTF